MNITKNLHKKKKITGSIYRLCTGVETSPPAARQKTKLLNKSAYATLNIFINICTGCMMHLLLQNLNVLAVQTTELHLSPVGDKCLNLCTVYDISDTVAHSLHLLTYKRLSRLF